jgi:hypothetical protein
MRIPYSSGLCASTASSHRDRAGRCSRWPELFLALWALRSNQPERRIRVLRQAFLLYWTDNFFAAHDTLNPAGNPEPAIHDWQFGATIGGALIHNKLFWFGSYQGTVQDGSLLQFASVPTSNMLTGNFTGLGTPIYNAAGTPFVNGTIPFADMSPIARAYLGYLPAPNQPGLGNNRVSNVPFGDRGQIVDSRVDYRISRNFSGFLRYGWSSFNDFQDSILGPVLGGTTTSGLRNHYGAVSMMNPYTGSSYGPDYGAYLMDPFNLRANYGPADWDRTNMLTISHVFDLPFGTGTNRWNQGVVGKILGNWKLTGLFNWATGTPYSIVGGPLTCNCAGVGAVFAGAGVPGVNGNASFNPAFFSLPSQNTFGGAGRNSFRGPDLTNYSLALLKTFPIAENKSFELRAESYNLLNSSRYGNP